MRRNIILLSLTILMVVILGGCSQSFTNPDNRTNLPPFLIQNVSSFDECVEAGNPVMESYPEQCEHNGEIFINNVSIKEDITRPHDDLLLCTMQYEPVCGVDGVTYGNSCMAQNVEIAYEGECSRSLEEVQEEGGIIDNYGNQVDLTCQTWFDGCNTCKLSLDGNLMCTKMFCETPKEATCLDNLS